jgi:YidC/Oxa1 family membrane protein insertase
MANLYHLIIYQPLLNALVFLYQTIAFGDLGLAIVFLTILIRLLLFPVFQKSVEHQMIMQYLQPKLKKIQETHATNREEQSRAMLALYREHRVNPFSGFLLLLVQLPILFAVYRIFLTSFTPTVFKDLYGFITPPATLNTTLLGLINLGKGSMVVVACAAIAQYFQGRMSLRKLAPGEVPGAADRMARNMVLIGPALTILIFFRLPAALALYWFVTALFSIGQQAIVNKKIADGKLGIIHTKTN